MPAPTSTAASALEAERLYEAGRFEEALTAFRSGPPEALETAQRRGRIAACLLALGRPADARPILEALAAASPDHPVLLVRLAAARAGTGDDAAALDALEAAAEAGARPVLGADTDPAFDRLRSDPRFAPMQARIAANEAVTAHDPAFRAFDFWVGDWEARTVEGTVQGHNSIERVLGGAALIERWTGAAGYRGTSLNRYDRTAGTWRQTWVDDRGDIVEFEDGVAADGRVVFHARMREGDLRRLTFTDRGPDAFDQLSERSSDGGATWSVEYDFRYARLSGG